MKFKTRKVTEWKNLFVFVQLAIKSNKNFCVFFKKSFYNYTQMLNILKRDGFLQSFEERGSCLILRLHKVNWLSRGEPSQSISNLRPVVRLHKSFSWKAKHVQKYVFLKGGYVTHLLNSHKGLVSGFGAKNMRIGCIPLVQIC